MDENTIFAISIIIVILSLIGLLITVNLLVYYCCVEPRRRRNGSIKKTSTNNKHINENNENKLKLLLNNSDDIIININESNRNLLVQSNQELKLNSDVYKYLGVSLSEIPFIDEDSKSNSCVDLTWNPYKPLTY